MQWIKYIFIDNISGTCKYSVLFFKHLVDLLLIKPTNADPPPSNIAIKFCSKKKFSRGSMQLWDNHNHTFGVKIYPPPPTSMRVYMVVTEPGSFIIRLTWSMIPLLTSLHWRFSVLATLDPFLPHCPRQFLVDEPPLMSGCGSTVWNLHRISKQHLPWSIKSQQLA